MNDSKRIDNILTGNAMRKLTWREWEIICQTTNTLPNQLRMLGSSKEQNNTSNVIYIGDELYLSLVRPEIEKKGLILKKLEVENKEVIEKNKKKEKKVVIKKADLIRQENIKNDIKESLINIFDNNKKIKHMDLLIVKLMFQLKEILEKYTKNEYRYQKLLNMTNNDTDDLNKLKNTLSDMNKQIEEIIVGYQKILADVQTKISPQLVLDFSYWVDDAKKIIKYNTIDTIMNRPELIFKTKYDIYLEQKPILLYKSQQELFDFVKVNLSFFVLLHTIMGSGKTALVLPLCQLLMEKTDSSKEKILYCCPNISVLLEVAQQLFSAGIIFCIVSYDNDKKCLHYRSVAGAKDADRYNPDDNAIIFLADPFCTEILLQQRINKLNDKKKYYELNKINPNNFPLIETRIPKVPSYLFIYDEATKDADIPNSLMTEWFIRIMKIIPEKVILMSATLPHYDQMKNFYDDIINNKQYAIIKELMVLKTISSSEAKVGCSFISSSGEIFIPHSVAQTKEELKNVLEIIKTNPFIGRFYTFTVLMNMCKQFEEAKLPYPNLSELFTNPSLATQTNLQSLAYSMIETLINTEEENIINKVTLNNIKTNYYLNKELDKILTIDYDYFNKGTIVFCNNPLEVALSCVKGNYGKDIMDVINFDKIIKEYRKLIEGYIVYMRRIDDKKDGNKLEKGAERNTIDKHTNVERPSWKFPLEYQLGTDKHIKKYKYNTLPLVAGFVTADDIMDIIDSKSDVSNVNIEILTMLAMGIGIYSTKDSNLDNPYLKKVLGLAKEGKIRMLFSDSSLAYGTNLSVSTIIIVDDIEKSIVSDHSIKTIFQMMGRAGRGGNLSYEANVYTTGNKLFENIKKYIKNELNENEHDEINNILSMYAQFN